MRATPTLQRGLMVATLTALAALLTVSLGWNLPLASRIDLKPGQVAPFDVVAPRQLTYTSALVTEQARARAANAVPNQYDTAAGAVRREQVGIARTLVGEIGAIRADTAATHAQQVEALLNLEELLLSSEAAERLLALSDEEWAQVDVAMPQAVDRLLRDEIRAEDLATAQRRVPSTLEADLTESAAVAAAELVRPLILPNSFLNVERTQTMRESASADVSPQTASVEQGEIILRAGDIASPEDVEALEQIGLLAQQWDMWSLLRAFIFSILLVTVMAGAMYRLRRQAATSVREFTILIVLATVWLVAAKFMIVPHDWLPYLYPLAALSMLVACLVDVRSAVLMTVTFALAILYLSDANAALVAYGALGGIAGALVIGRAERLTAFLWAALAVMVVNVLAVLAFRLPFDAMSNQQIVQLGFVLLLNGGLAASIALLGYFGLGNLFGLTTSLQLNELSRPTHPLLRQLLLKAPGTYHHTIVVSNLAERAAAAIGADALLARVGAYYHDIGKTVRPYFFTENIGEDSSPHDKLDPLTSAQIIISHVSDGLDLAQKYRLPRRLHDFIREHHGTSLVQYFYVRAVRTAVDGESVDQAQFRYPGPRPQSRETAILALADTCEAAVRAMRPSTREDLATLVNRLLDERVAEGELTESNLTFMDLAAIRGIFVQVLQGVHHPRINYPEPARPTDKSAAAAPPLPPTADEALAIAEEPAGNGRTYAGVEEIPESEAMISVDKAG